MLSPVATLVQCRRRRGTGFYGYAIVANREGKTVTAVDLTTFAATRQIALEAKPAAVIAHPRRPLALVLTPDTGTVCEIEAAGLKLLRKVQVARTAHSMRLAAGGGSLWLLCRESRQLVELDLDRFQPVSRIALPAEPAGFDLSPDGKLAAASLEDSGAVVFVELENRRCSRPIAAAGRVGTIRFRSDSRQLLAGSAGEPMLTIVEAPAGRVVVRLPLAIRPRELCMKNDGGQLFLTGEGMDAVVVVYPYRTEVAETLLAGKAPAAMAVSSAPDYLLVSNPSTGDVSILDMETRRLTAVVAVGEGLASILVTPDNQYALVLNQRSGNMAVIRLAAVVARRTRQAPLFTMVPVGWQPVSAAVCGL